MTETQVIIRLDKELLKELDKVISTQGFKTRNEWFRNKVREYIEESKKEEMLKKLSKLNTDEISDENIVKMIKDWRKKGSK